MSMTRPPLVYVTASGNLYGTERMVLATAQGLADEFEPVIVTPPGDLVGEVLRAGLEVRAFRGLGDLTRLLIGYLSAHHTLAFAASDVKHSLIFAGLDAVFGRRTVHLHPVHGGNFDDRISYGRKRHVNRTGAVFVAVSDFVRRRLIAHRVRPDRITVIENFLPDARVASAIRRPPFRRPGVRRVIVVSRVDWNKKVDLLLDALDRRPELSALSVRVLGGGHMLQDFRRRAAERNPDVEFVGYSRRVPEELAVSDLLVHTCPDEPFGLAILEAMAADVPVMVPDTGGAGSLIEPEVSGFRFRAGDAGSLAARLAELMSAPAARLNAVTAAARRSLQTRFSAAARIADYRRLLRTGLGEPRADRCCRHRRRPIALRP